MGNNTQPPQKDPPWVSDTTTKPDRWYNPAATVWGCQKTKRGEVEASS